MKYDKKFITAIKDSQENPVFNSFQALEGVTLASIKTIQEEGETTEELTSVENFRQISADKYSAIVDGVSHYFDGKGNCIDDSTVGNLTFVEGNIQKSIDNAAESGDSGGDEDKKATISSLNPRDYFAQEVMNGFMKNVDKPFSMSDADIYKYTTLAYKIAQSMINVSADNRSTDPESEGEDPSAEVVIDKATLNGNTEKLLNNIVAALDKTNAEITVGTEAGLAAERITNPQINKLIEEYVAGATAGTKVGLNDLISAINNISVSGGSATVNVDLSTLVTAINNMGSTRTANIGNSGLGRDENHPIYISGGGFPNKDSLAASIPANSISDFLTFNGLGAVGYSGRAAVKETILGYLNSYADIDALSSAIYTKIQGSIDTRIKSWLNATTIVADGTGWKLNVPNSI